MGYISLDEAHKCTENQNPPGENNPAAFGVQEEDLEEAVEEPEAQLDMSLASPTRAVTDTHVVVRATSSRRRQKRKRVNRKQKVQVLTGKLNLIPFVPNRALDFPSHENLLRRLGLWDFVHVELDCSNLRVDLIAQLVVNYKRLGRVSEVNGVRIKVSSADLGRALKLPPAKKDNSGVVVVMDEDAELVSEVSIRFVEELMSNLMLIEIDGQDPWIMPDEVMHWIEVIRRGHPDKVEWASLMWFMVEKELSQGLRLVDCYYASHLQHLIKHQNASLFLVEHDEDVIAREEEEEEEEQCAGDVEMIDEECVGTAVSEACVVDEIVFSHGIECDADVSEGCVDYKKAFKLSEESKAAVSEGCVDDKMAFTLNNESEAVVTKKSEEDKEYIRVLDESNLQRMQFENREDGRWTKKVVPSPAARDMDVPSDSVVIPDPFQASVMRELQQMKDMLEAMMAHLLRLQATVAEIHASAVQPPPPPGNSSV